MSERLTESELDEVATAARTAQEYLQLAEVYPAWLLSMVDEITALRAEVERLHQHRHGHMPDCAGMDEPARMCGCGYLQGEAYRDLVDQLSARDAEIKQIKKDVMRQMTWTTEAQDERDALSDVLSRNGFVPCDIAACNCGSWHARYGLSERWDELRDDLADAGHPLCNENGNLMRNALASLVAERDLFRRETVALAKDAMKVDAEVRALRDFVAKFRAWVQHHDDCDEYPLDGYEREHGVPAGESACNCGLNELLTGEPGPGGSDGA